MLRAATLRDPHGAFLRSAVPRLAADPRLVGAAAGGSLLSGRVDEFSDLDLVVFVEPESYESILGSMRTIAATLGDLLAAFRGDHVGEPRLLICLYGPELLHVDLKFVDLRDAGRRVEDPVVLWERDGRVTAALRESAAAYPQPDLQWIEDRFWVWVHYAAGKIGRGELLEAIDLLAYLRKRVLGPLILVLHGAQPSGVRRIETVAPGYLPRLRATLAEHDRTSCARALEAAIELYRDLRERLAPADLVRGAAAEEAVVAYLAEIRRRAPAG